MLRTLIVILYYSCQLFNFIQCFNFLPNIKHRNKKRISLNIPQKNDRIINYQNNNNNNNNDNNNKQHFFSRTASFDTEVSIKKISTQPKKLESLNLLTSNATVDTYLRHFIYNKQWDSAKNVLSSLNNTQFSMLTIDSNTGNIFNRTLIYVILETCQRAKNFDIILPLVETIPKNLIENYYLEQSINQSSINLLRSSLSDDIIPFLSELSSKKTISLAQPLLTYLSKQFGHSIFNIKALSIIIKGYGNMKNENMVDNILASMTANPNDNVQVDVIFLNTVIDAYINCGNLEKALDLFDYATIRQDGNVFLLGNKRMRYITSWDCFPPNLIYPNVRTFNTIVKGYRNSGTSSFAIYQTLLNKMNSLSINIDSITINTIIDSIVSSGDTLKAEYLLNSAIYGTDNIFKVEDETTLTIFMNKSSVCSPGIEAYTSVMKGFSQDRNLDGVFRIVELMKTNSIRCNTYTITAVIDACIAAGKIGKARDLLLGGNSDFFQNFTAEESSFVCGSFVIGLCKLFYVDSERDTSSYRNNRYLKEALTVLIDMEKKNIKPDTVTLNAFMKGLCSSTLLKIEDSLFLLKSMIAENILPDAYTYSILFSAMGTQGRLDQAIELYKDNLNSMDTVSTNSLLKSFADSSNPLSSIDFFYELVSKNQTTGKVEYFIPDKFTYTILFKAVSAFVVNSEDSNINIGLKSTTNSNNQNINSEKLKSSFPIPVDRIMSRNSNVNLSLNNAYNAINLNKYYPTISKEISNREYRLGSSIFISSGINLTLNSYKLNDINLLVKSLFSQLRYDYKIEPDIVMVKAINKLFSHNIRISRSILSNQEILSKDTARFLFQEIVIAGFHPRDILAILNCCGYSFKQTEEYLYDENILKKLRASAASYRIFTKHGWNKIQSGWSTIF